MLVYRVIVVVVVLANCQWGYAMVNCFFVV